MAGGGAALSRVSSRGRLAAPYLTVPYSTVPYCVLPYSRNIRQSISYPVSLKESQGERKPLWETGENVENSVESVWETCFKALRPLRAGAGAAEHGAVPTGGMCGCGVGLRPGAVWRVLSAGAGVVDAFGWRVVAAVRCGTRVQRGARWLAFLLREKMLDKLCKSILNWKQGITQAAAGDGLRHRPHRRSCSAHPTSTSSVAAWPPRHLPPSPKAMHDLIRGGPCPLGLPRGCAHPTSTSSVAATSVMCCASDARLSGAALRKTETKNSAPHRTDAGRSFVTAAAPARRPFHWLSGCLSAGYPVRLPFRSRSYVPAATVQPFSRGLRGLARAPRLEPGAHMVVQAAERLHHRP